MRHLSAIVLAAAALLLAPAAVVAAPPVNDAYLASLPVDNAEFTATADTTEATTQPDLFNPSRSGQPLGGGAPETTNCKGTAFDKTVWYDLAPQADGGVAIRATGFATVVAVYEWSEATSQIRRMVDCSTTTSADDLIVDVRARRNYTIQVGGAGGAFGLMSLKVDYFPDRDRDGEFDALDSCPTVPGIARFDGCPPELRAVPSINYDRVGGGIRITRLVVDRVPKGAKVVARCSGCGSQTVTARRQGRVTLSRMIGRAVGSGGAVEVRVTMGRTGSGTYRFGATGSSFTWPVANGRLGTRVARCLNVRTGRKERCR